MSLGNNQAASSSLTSLCVWQLPSYLVDTCEGYQLLHNSLFNHYFNWEGDTLQKKWFQMDLRMFQITSLFDL